MNLAAWAMKYRPIVLTATLLLMAWGILSYFTMPRREDPEYVVRTCVVTTKWPGAPAVQVEELVTKPLEEALKQIPEVLHVRSMTKVGVSTIYFDAEDSVLGRDVANVWDKVRARVARVPLPEPNLKADVNDEYGDTYILVLSVYQAPPSRQPGGMGGPRYTPRQLDVISQKVRDELRLLPGVAKVDRYGVRSEAIYVQTDLGNWSKLRMKTDELAQLIEARNIVSAGGSVDTKAGRYTIKPGGELNAVDEIESIVVGLAGTSGSQRPVYLRDLGLKTIRDYEDPPGLICRYGDPQTSEPAVEVAVSMKSGANIINVCNAAKAAVSRMGADGRLPPDIQVVPVSDQSINVQAKIGDVVVNVIEAIVIVVIVVYLIVGFRSAAVMAGNIPIVVLGSIAVITLFGVQLEQISLASIIIALGLLVDNAVQICDRARTNQLMGMSPEKAVVIGAKEVASPMFMGTATTVAAFLPMLIGLVGSKREYVYSLPVTLSVTLLLSWLFAMTFCPILAAWFIRAPSDPSRPDAPLAKLFAFLQTRFGGARPSAQDSIVDRLMRAGVRWAIRFRFPVLIAAILLFIGAIMLPVGSEFFPKDIRDQFAVQIWLPETATIAQTDEAARQVEDIVRKLSPITNVKGEAVERLRAMRTMVGGGGSRWYLSWNPEPRRANYAEMLIRTTDGRLTPAYAARVLQVASQGDAESGLRPVVGTRVVPRELFLGPSAEPVEVRVIGAGFADLRQLRSSAERVKAMVRAEPGTWDVHDTWGESGYQLLVDLDPDKANLAGVTSASVARTLNAYFSGHHLTTFREGDHTVPVYLRLQPEERGSLEGLRTAYVEGLSGKVPLPSIGKIESQGEPATIWRRDLNRVIEVRSQVTASVRGNDVVNRLMNSAAMRQLRTQLPADYRIEVGGMLEKSNESASQLSMSLFISVLAIVLLLVIQYNGWSKTIVILATLPLALIGALPGLYFSGNPLGFMPQLGILALFGIVLNTAIIFIEFADVLVRQAAERSDGSGPICGLTHREFHTCLVEAARQRLLPIFLTTSTTIGGLIPLALWGGPLWAGMAWCMISGLAIATVLTLAIVPALYAIVVGTFGVQPVQIARPVGQTNDESTKQKQAISEWRATDGSEIQGPVSAIGTADLAMTVEPRGPDP